ncbi:MAG: hypothetical protein P8X39_08615 [Desulfofustis sp.]|jgi:hypothetical protein
MATQKKRRKTKIKFELSRSGIGSIAIVCFCIFLWMFIFGVWAGQSLLKPTPPVVTGFKAGSVQQEQPVIQLEENKKVKP